jgi:choline transport protein
MMTFSVLLPRPSPLTDNLSTWIGLASTLAIVLPSGGPAAFVYGFLFCVACNFCIAASLGEMVSVWPTAGGQYHYSYSLSNSE